MPSPRREAWIRFLVGCFALIAGFRIFLVERFASSVAYGDDLDGIARRILLPWENGTLTWSSMFAAHNGDHRILATRLWEILWYELNGTWDPKLVMIAKVPIFAAAAVIFIHLLTSGLPRYRYAAGGALALLFAFPFGFANALWAFQSQFDFFLLASALGWLALMKGRAWLALLLAMLSVFTLASGPIVAASFLPYFAARWLLGEWSASRTAVHSFLAAGIVALGMASPTQEAMPHTGTVVEKAATFARLCAWPHSNLLSIVERLPESARYVPARLLRIPNEEGSYLLRAAATMRAQPLIVPLAHVLCAAVLLAPTVLLLVAVIRRRVPLRTAAGPLGVAGFAALMIAATAVARANQVTIAPRFLDHVSLAGFASLAAGAALIAQTGKGRRAMTIWIVFVGLGYLATMVVTTAQMSRRAPASALAVLQEYYATDPHNHRAMTEQENFRKFIVSDDPTQFMAELDTPGLERVLPLAVIAPGERPGLAARMAFALGRVGWVFALVGMGSCAWIAWRERRASTIVHPATVPVAHLQV